MALHPSSENLYERIFLTGGQGSGKSRSYFTIADLAQKTDSDAKFYILNTDFDTERFLNSEDFKHLKNIEYQYVHDWETLTSGLDKFTEAMRPQDWLVIDMLSFAWEAVQVYYTKQMYEQNMSDYFLNRRKQMAEANKKGNVFEGDTDWGTINNLYRDRIANKIVRTQGHVLATAPVKSVSERDDKAIKIMYGKHSVRPEGQKLSGHLFHTVLILQEITTGDYRLMTIKDRERKQFEGEKVTTFANTYLLGAAGWKL